MANTTTVFDVMNCSPISSVAELGEGRWTMEPKLDGFRLLAHVLPGRVEFYTRSKKRQDGKLPHVERQLLETFPPDTLLDGEICYLTFADSKCDNDFEWVQSVMLSKPEKSVKNQEADGRWLQYIAFDMILFAGKDLRDEPQADRVKALASALGPTGTKHVSAMQAWVADDDIHDALVENGFEGTIVKDADGPYRSGVRGYGWYKIKDQPHVDCVIVGYKPGKGKFLGKVGAVFFGQPLDGASQEVLDKIEKQRQKGKPIPVHTIAGVDYVERGHASGMDDAERDDMTANMDSYLGTVIEVAHMGIFPGGVTMRHPNFKRFRPDKPVNEVIWHDR